MLRVIGCALLFLAGIGFGLYGIDDPLTFGKFACIVMCLAGAALNAWDAIENG